MILIYRWIVRTDRADTLVRFVVVTDPLLIRKRNLGVGDYGRQKDNTTNGMT